MTARAPLARALLTLAILLLLGACRAPDDRRGPAADVLERAHAAVQIELSATEQALDGLSGRAVAALAPRLEPHRALLRAHAEWALRAVPPLDVDLDGFRPVGADPVIDLDFEGLVRNLGDDLPVEQWWVIGWDPVRLAFLMRTMIIFREISAEDAARRAMIDNFAPPRARLADADPDAPRLVVLSGHEAFVVALERRGDGYIPVNLRWLTSAPKAAQAR